MRNTYDSISEFIFMEDPVEKADVILVPGGSHPQLMEKAAALYHAGYAKLIIPSGHYNKKIPDHPSESHYLKSIGVALGVPEEAILIEDKATHTFDNGKFSYELCQQYDIPVNKVIIACKSFHARRSYMTYKMYFPKETEFVMQPIADGQNITKDNWINDPSKIKIVMGEVVKIGTYFEDLVIKM